MTRCKKKVQTHWSPLLFGFLSPLSLSGRLAFDCLTGYGLVASPPPELAFGLALLVFEWFGALHDDGSAFEFLLVEVSAGLGGRLGGAERHEAVTRGTRTVEDDLACDSEKERKRKTGLAKVRDGVKVGDGHVCCVSGEKGPQRLFVSRVREVASEDLDAAR